MSSTIDWDKEFQNWIEQVSETFNYTLTKNDIAFTNLVKDELQFLIKNITDPYKIDVFLVFDGIAYQDISDGYYIQCEGTISFKKGYYFYFDLIIFQDRITIHIADNEEWVINNADLGFIDFEFHKKDDSYSYIHDSFLMFLDYIKINSEKEAFQMLQRNVFSNLMTKTIDFFKIIDNYPFKNEFKEIKLNLKTKKKIAEHIFK